VRRQNSMNRPYRAYSGLLGYCSPQSTRFQLVVVPILPLSVSPGQHMRPFPKTLTFTCISNPIVMSDFVETFESTIPLSRLTVGACPVCLPPSHQTICPFCRCRRCITCEILPGAFPMPSTTSCPAGRHNHVYLPELCFLRMRPAEKSENNYVHDLKKNKLIYPP
jgi:hypothetical protein